MSRIEEAEDRPGLDVREVGEPSPLGRPATVTPMRRTPRAVKPSAALIGTNTDRKDDEQQDDREPDDDERERHERVGEALRDVDRDGRVAGHRDGRAEVGEDLVLERADVLDDLLGLRVGGRALGGPG